MKTLLILSHTMELGGAERSLLGLLNAIDPKEYSIDLLDVYKRQGYSCSRE